MDKDPTISGTDADATGNDFDVEWQELLLVGDFEIVSEGNADNDDNDEGALSGGFVLFVVRLKIRPVCGTSRKRSSSSSSLLSINSKNVRFFSLGWFDQWLIVVLANSVDGLRRMMTGDGQSDE